MATISEFLQSPLVTWAYTFNGNKKPETVADFADGVFLNEIMVEIDPTYFTLSRVQHNVYGDISTRVQNLDTLVRHLKCYYQERLQQVVLARIPDIVLIAHDPEIDASIEELTRILLLMLGVAVQCENKEHFIGKIKELDFEVQRLLVDCIKQVTDNTDNVLPFRLSEIAEYPVEQLILMAETMYYHIGQLVDERDASVGMITHLTYERDSLLKEQESHPKTSLSPPLSPRHSFKKTSPVLTATKEKLRLLTEEVEEKNIMIQELKEELLQGKRIIEKLRQDNKNLSQDARWVKAYRDESDMLKAKADKVDKLEADNVKYKDKLRDLDYYKKRAEELKEQNEMLYDTKVVLEEQLVGLSTKDEKLELSEEANKKLKSHIHELAEERQIDQVKLKEVMEENAQLVLDKQNSMAELAALMAELDFLRGKVSPGTNSLASEYKEQNSVEILRLQKENQQLQKTVARVEDLERKNQELRNVLKINNSELKAKAKQLGSDTYKELQLEDSLSLSTHQQENTHVVDSNRHKKNFTNEKLRAEEENIVRLKQQVKDSEIKETNLCKQLKEKANRIVDLTETIQEREKSLGILETRLKENEEQQYKVENKMKNQQKEISDLEQRMEELLSTTSTAHKQLKAKDRELDELSSRLEDALSHKNRCDDNLRRKEKECYDLKNRIDKLTAENERLAENARIKEEKIASLKTRIEELLRSLDEKNDLFNKDLREKEKENKELERRVESLGDLVEEVKRLKDLVRQKEAKLETLSVTLQEKTGKLHHLETRLEDLDNGNKKLVHTLKLKEKKIESLESSLAEVETDASSTYLKEGKIAEMRKSIEGKDNKILELENRLEDLVSCNNKMQHILKLKDEKLQELEKQIQEIEVAAAEKTKLSQALDHKLKKIQSLEKRNEDLANETLQLRNDVDLKDSRLKSLETRISELEESLKSCQLIEHDLKYKDDRITSLGRIIQEREEKLAELEHRFEDTQAHNHKLNRSVKIKEDKILVLENRLEQLEGITAEKQKLSQLLQQREEKIIVLDSKIDELQDVLAENEKLAHVTKQKDEKLQRLQERLDEVEDAVKMNSRLNHFLKQRDEKIKSQDNRINELQSSIESREEQYQKEKSHLEYRIKTLERNLEEVSQAKVQRTNSVKRREEKIVDLDKKRTALEQYLQEREGRIQDLQNKLEGSSDRFRRLDISVGEKEMRIAELEAKLLEAQDDARENRKLNQIMKTKDARIDSLETKMQNIEGLLKKYKAEVQEKSEKLDNVQQRLEETLNLNNKLDQSVRKKEENIRTLEKNIQSIEKREEELEELLETKGEKLAEYKKRVLELEDGLEEKIDKINEQQKRLDDVLKSANADQNYRVTVEEKQSRIMELEREIKELKDSSDSVKCSTVEVQYLNNAVKKQKEKVQELQTKLEEYIDYSKKLDFENKQKHKTIETLEKRVEQLVANQDTADKSQYKALQQKDSKMATMNSTLHQQESEILSLESRLDEAAARVDKLNQTVEQKEERIKALKIRLEDAVHQNNKLNHTLELKDDKIHGLERRLEDSLKEFDVLRGNLAALDRKPEGEKSSKSKGSSSQTIIFKPANNANNMKAVELIADAERRLEERNEEVRILEKQNATLGAQSESMSAKNASLVIENESLKNDLKNLKSDYSNLLTDVGEARDYYNQLDISASKMVHRCEMLEQLNCTLEEENKALMEQVTKLVSQNQQMLMRSLDDKEQSMEDERLFSDRLFALQREKERLEEQVELANRALAECTPTKKKRNMFKRGAHRMLKATGLKKKKDESNKKATVQLLRVDHSPFREHFDSYRPVNADLESEGYCSTVNVTPLKSRNDDSRSSFDSRDSSASGDSSKISNRSHGSFLPVSQSEVHLRRPKDSHTLPRSTSTANAVQLRRQSQDVSAYRARHVRSEYYGDRDLSPVKLHRPKSLDALNKISDDSSPLPGTRVRVNSNNVRMSKTVQDGPSPFRRQQKIASSSPATPTGMRRRSPPRQTSSPRVSPTTSPHVSPKSSPIQARKLYSSPPSPAMSRSSAGSFCGDTLPVKERNLNTPVNENYSMLPSSLSSTVVRGGTTFALTSSSSSSFKTTDPQEVANPQVSSSSDPAYRKEGGRPKSYNATPVKESRPGEEKVIHTSQTDDAPIERFVREMERSKELNRGSFRGSNRSLSGSSLRGSNRSLNRVTASALTSRQGTTVYAVYSSTSNQKDSINNTENVMIDATGIDVSITPASEALSASSQLPPSGPLEETNRPTRDSGVRVKTNETSSVPPSSNLKNETLAGNDSYQRDELNPNYVSTSSSRSRSMSGRSITSQSLTAQTRNVGDEKTVVIARVRELEQQNGESCHLRSPSTSSIVSVGADDDYKSRSVNSDVQQGVRKQQKNNGHKKKDERIQSKVVSAAQKENTISRENDRNESHVSNSSTTGSATNQGKKVQPVWYEYGCV